ncbi:MAG TPA: DUF6599 family protein [Candidatus Acidoferrum sp.]|jgi:hypothetical protein
MRKLIPLFFVAVMLATVGVFASAAGTSLLPDHFGAWQAAGPSKLTSGQNLNAWFGADPRRAISREEGLATIEERTYRNGDKEINLNLYVFKDPTGAYQDFTQGTSTNHRAYAYGDEASFDASTGTILVGNLVVSVGSAADLKPEELAGLDESLRLKADHTPYPPLRTYLPVKDRIFGSQKFAAGPDGFRCALNQIQSGAFQDLANEVGFNSGVEAMLAKYQSGKEHGALLLLEYPTPQIAEQHLHHLKEALPAAAKRAGVNVERKASMLSLVFDASSKEYAQKLRDAVDYETQVTWNETGHAATDPPIVVILVKIIVYILMFLGLTVGLGIAYGGTRILIKRLLPGKIFDRPQDLEVLQMGLSGKKIDPSDMY